MLHRGFQERDGMLLEWVDLLLLVYRSTKATVTSELTQIRMAAAVVSPTHFLRPRIHSVADMAALYERNLED